MSYFIKEIFYSIQGEGFYSGRPAVFCRFAGCNLWSGEETDREKAVCKFCDTDFVGCDGQEGGKYSRPEQLVEKIYRLWLGKNSKAVRPFVVCTGGEPLLQLDTGLIEALHRKGCEVAIETNGTLLPPPGIDWVCVSPKADAKLLLRSGNELKLVFPQFGAEPEKYETLDFQHFFLQPMDSPERETNTRLALEYILTHPKWRLSLQIHKILGVK
ncbi:MAG: 7-carboxy-7-deazaguanine synthase [Smithella sp. SDB]|nr:MAG: 7-carboxy-7-deazaguanine synthase [Smithella sp. SDB]